MPSVEQLNLGHLVAGLIGGTVVLVVAVAVPRVRPFVPALLAVAAVVLGAPEVRADLEATFVASMAVAALAVACAAFQCARHASPAIVLVLLVVAITGLWAGLPDTEVVLVLAGVVLPVTVVSAVRAVTRLEVERSAPWSAALLGTCVVWVVAVSSAGRAEAALGGVACLGALLVVPLLALVTAKVWDVLRNEAPVPALGLLLGAQIGTALLCARVAARADDLGTAAAIAAASSVGVAVAVGAGARAVSRPVR